MPRFGEGLGSDRALLLDNGLAKTPDACRFHKQHQEEFLLRFYLLNEFVKFC